MALESREKAKLHVSISGGGIAGLALASFLSKADDVVVDVYEAKSEVRTIGAGIAIWQCYWDLLNGTHDLEARCASRGIPPPKWDEAKGPTLRRSDSSVEPHNFFSLDLAPMIIPRTVLLEILLEEAKTGNCTLHTDKRLVSHESNHDGTVTLHFADGARDKTDLLIGADGVHSKVRDTMFHDNPAFAQPQFSGQLAYRLKCRAKDLPPDHLAHSGFQIWCGDGRHVTSNSVGDFIQMTAYDNIDLGPNTTYPEDWVKQVSIAEVCQGYEGWEPELLTLLQTAEDASRWAIHVVNRLPRYVSESVALVGDAAHAMTPHIGLGGGQGIHDALVLSRLLMHPAINRSTLAKALTVYDTIRQPSSQQVAKWSLECGLMYGFLLPEKRDLPPDSLSREFYMRTDWLREKHVLGRELESAETMLNEIL